jgi:choline dehydrogenase-like flavoprotein
MFVQSKLILTAIWINDARLYIYMYVCISQLIGCRPQSRGHIQLKSSDPFEKPQITLNYLDNQEVRQRIDVFKSDRYALKFRH